MKPYNCEDCSFSSKLKTDYSRHLNTKKHIKNIIKRDDINEKYVKSSYSCPQNTSKSLPPHLKITQKTSQNMEKKHNCKYCNKQFSRIDNLNRHVKNTCKNAKDKLTYKELFLEIKDQFKKEKEDLKDQINLLLTKVGNTTINNTNNIQLNSYGKEDLSHITDTLKTQLLKMPYGMIPKMIEKVHFNPDAPQNNNILLTNKNDNKIKIFCGSKWIYQDKKDTIDDLVDGKYFILDSHYETIYNTISIHNKNIYEKFRTFYDEKNKELCDKVKKDSELVLLNNR